MQYVFNIASAGEQSGRCFLKDSQPKWRWGEVSDGCWRGHFRYILSFQRCSTASRLDVL